MSVKCPECGTLLVNGWVGPCPKCGHKELFVSEVGKAFESVVIKITDQPTSGSISAATTAVSTVASAFYDAKLRLDSLRALGVPERHLEPLDNDINKLNEDKIQAEERARKMFDWSIADRDKFTKDIIRRLDKHVSTIRNDIKLVGIKVNGTTDLIQRLSEEVVTKDDLKNVEDLLVQNQEIIVDVLNQRMSDLKKELAPVIEKKVNPEKVKVFWGILEKISILGGTAQFAEYIKKLIDFLIENKIIQTTLPLILKTLFG